MPRNGSGGAAAALLGCVLAVCAGAPSGCGRAKEPPAAARPSAQVERVLDSWMGRYARRDDGLRVLLSSQGGWIKLRDMALFDAVDQFSGGGADSDRIGLARGYLALADAYAALDELFLSAEAGYLEALGEDATPEERARGGLARLRRGELSQARAIFAASPPAAVKAAWGVGRAGLAAAEGRNSEAADLLGGAGAEGSDLAAVAGYAWGVSGAGAGRGPFGRASRALAAGDFGGALAALRRVELGRVPQAAGSDLFAYLLLRRCCAGLALKALGEAEGPERAFLAGLAREHLDDGAAAAALFARAEAGQGAGNDAVWLFSACLGEGEAARLAAARRGGVLAAQGRGAEASGAWMKALGGGEAGPLVAAEVARAKARAKAAPAGEDLVAQAETAVTEVASLASQLPSTGEGGDDLLPSLYPARTAAVARAAAEVCARAGQHRRALEILDGAHRKSGGYRPDFVNDVAFLVELSRSFAEVGEYAPAVAALFDLNRYNPTARLAYESLKRSYAARTGGETQPRY